MLAILVMASCGPSYEDARRKAKAEQAKRKTEDSLALKVGVGPTLDCLPLYLASELCLFDTARADIRLKPYAKGIDCVTDLSEGRIEGAVTDVVRAERLREKGTPVEYVAATNAYWQLVTNQKARLKEIRQLTDKMVAITRFSAKALLADMAVDSVKLNQEDVYRVQINDDELCLGMLANNIMDAMVLTEPQATRARMGKNPVLMDSREKDLKLGAIAFLASAMEDEYRKAQVDVFIKGYNQACDSINEHGLAHYADLLERFCGVDEATLGALPKMRFPRAAAPRDRDLERAREWLSKQ